MPGLHKGVSIQHANQQQLAKSRHQPSDRDKQARDRLRNKAKIKSCAYIQLGEKALQTVHQTFEPNIPVVLHLLALANITQDTDTVPTLFVIQEGIHCMPTTDYTLRKYTARTHNSFPQQKKALGTDSTTHSN